MLWLSREKAMRVPADGVATGAVVVVGVPRSTAVGAPSIFAHFGTPPLGPGGATFDYVCTKISAARLLQYCYCNIAIH